MASRLNKRNKSIPQFRSSNSETQFQSLNSEAQIQNSNSKAQIPNPNSEAQISKLKFRSSNSEPKFRIQIPKPKFQSPSSKAQKLSNDREGVVLAVGLSKPEIYLILSETLSGMIFCALFGNTLAKRKSADMRNVKRKKERTYPQCKQKRKMATRKNLYLR